MKGARLIRNLYKQKQKKERIMVKFKFAKKWGGLRPPSPPGSDIYMYLDNHQWYKKTSI